MPASFNLIGDGPLFLPDTDTYPESIREHLPLNTICDHPAIRLTDNPSITFFYLRIGAGTSIINQNNLAAMNEEAVMLPLDAPAVTQGVILRRNATNPILHKLVRLLERYRLEI